MPDDILKTVDRLDKAVFGDRDNPKDSPGILSELAQMNKTLTELSNSARWIVRIVLSAVAVALLALVVRTP